MDTTTEDTLAEADQHYAALGLTPGAVRDYGQVYAAWKARMKVHHPDTGSATQEGRGSNEIAARINAARDWFKKNIERELHRTTPRQSDPFGRWQQEWQRSQSSQDGQRGQRSQDRQEEAGRAERTEKAESADASDDADAAGAWEDATYRPNAPSKTSEFIEEYMRIRGWRVTAGEHLVPKNGYKSYPKSPIGEVLRDFEITEDRLQSELQDHRERQANPGGGDVTKASLKSGLRAFITAQADEERAKIFERLMVPLDAAQKAEAEEQWALLAATVFEDSPAIAIAGLKKIIHQVKLKALRMKVGNHLMVVFYSKLGGPGKSWFTKLFTSPMDELLSGVTLLSDVVDKSNIYLFSKPIVFLDDIDKLDEKYVGTFKSVLTADYIDRRTFFKQSMAHVRQQAVFVGTANRPITELVSDPSGHRRFLMLTFKHLERNNQKKIWGTVNKIDWELLWRSVSQDDEDPIEPVIEYMKREDAKAAMKSPAGKLTIWFRNLDLTKPEVQALARGNR
ncbi:hypothetical protein GCM10025880_48680 [Methylorubrum aminovorans]|uniref:VapE domain-containing protein n=1 Tax=Methylorubrum aminovorans TaxID=269069 RepID=UPI0023E96A3F|nr:VapE domain-containing protein [Methylorubrum aminovorans]GMA78451.1 hypothetical protein GCM10025880_48680 [Methylorubrum aminovorans]